MIYVLGFISQVLFFTRTLIQWVLSERARKVLSPTIYWVLSIVASYLFVIYGWFRNDFAILLGQLISYYIYIWNLNETGVWKRINRFLRSILVVTPIIAIVFVTPKWPLFYRELFYQRKNSRLADHFWHSGSDSVFLAFCLPVALFDEQK